MNGLPAPLDRAQRPALLIGVVALALCLIGAFINPGQFLIAYFYAYMFWLGIALGCMAFAMVHELVGGGWGVLIRRFQEAAAGTMPLLILFFIPIVLGMRVIFPWARPERVAADPILRQKIAYLNISFFLWRAVVYFAVWTAMAFFFRRWTLQADTTEDPRVARRLQRLSAAGLLIYMVTMTFAGIDWLMSREPQYFSTIYGFLLTVGQVLSGLAFCIVLLALLSKRPPFVEVIRPLQMNDLGTLLFTLVILFSYMAFAQYLVNWSGNMQTEITWYIPRTSGSWYWIAGLLIVFHFFVPFFLLLSRYNKQHPGILARIALLLLFMRLVDLFWMVAPSGTATQPHQVRWVAIVFAFITPLGIGGIWFAYFLRLLRGRPLLPLHRLGLPESVAYGDQASAGSAE